MAAVNELAQEALELGLTNHLVEGSELAAFTRALAADIAEAPAWALANTKALLFGGLDDSKQRHLIDQYVRFRNQDYVDFEGHARSLRQRPQEEDA